MVQKKVRLVSLVLCVVFVLVAVIPGSASARPPATLFGPKYVADSFDRIDIKQPGSTGSDPYWFIVNDGAAGQYYDHCGDASCVNALKKSGTTFARLKVFPEATYNPAEYVCAEIAELQTGYSYGLPAKWLPTVGHPVIVTARVRFSSNFKADGSGGAVGTSGIWLWNSPIDITSLTASHPIDAIGFSWAEAGSVGSFGGLRAITTQQTMPIDIFPISQADLTAWTTWTMVWSVNHAGQQSVYYLVNGRVIGHSDLQQALSALSFEVWNDNQFPVVWGDGSYTVEYHQPLAEQDFDIDYILASQF